MGNIMKKTGIHSRERLVSHLDAEGSLSEFYGHFKFLDFITEVRKQAGFRDFHCLIIPSKNKDLLIDLVGIMKKVNIRYDIGPSHKSRYNHTIYLDCAPSVSPIHSDNGITVLGDIEPCSYVHQSMIVTLDNGKISCGVACNLISRLFPNSRKNYLATVPYTQQAVSAQNNEAIVKPYDDVLTKSPPSRWYGTISKPWVLMGAFLFGLAPFFFSHLNLARSTKHFRTTNLHSFVSRDFYPRQRILKSIKSSFQVQREERNNVVAIVGCGGSGKTTLARIYAFKNQYDLIWEFNCESFESFLVSLEALATSLSIHNEKSARELFEVSKINNEKVKSELLVEFIRKHLDHFHKVMFIYDNLDRDLSYVGDYLPLSKGLWGHIDTIITTRNDKIRNFSEIQQTIIAEPLSRQELVIILNKGYPLQKESVQTVRNLIHSIPPYPLDVVVASKLLARNQASAQSLKDTLGNMANLDDNSGFASMNYRKSRKTIVMHSLESIIVENPQYVPILLAISCMASQDIPLQPLIQTYGAGIVSQLIHTLEKVSIVEKIDPHENTISFHRNIHQILTHFMQNQYKSHDSKKPFLGHLIALGNSYYGGLQHRSSQIIFPHIKKIYRYKVAQDPNAHANVGLVLARMYLYFGHRKHALQLASEIFNQLKGTRLHREIIAAVDIQATTLRYLGRHHEALSAINSCYERIPETKLSQQLNALESVILWETGSYNQALHILSRTKKMWGPQEILEMGPLLYSIGMNNMASKLFPMIKMETLENGREKRKYDLYRAYYHLHNHRYDLSLHIFREILRERRKIHGENYVLTGVGYYSLGYCYYLSGKVRKGLTLCKKGLEIVLARTGYHNPVLLTMTLQYLDLCAAEGRKVDISFVRKLHGYIHKEAPLLMPYYSMVCKNLNMEHTKINHQSVNALLQKHIPQESELYMRLRESLNQP